MFLSIIITCIIYWHETLNRNYSMINFYAMYIVIRVATEKTIVTFLIIASVISKNNIIKKNIQVILD